MADHESTYLTSTQVRARYGGISDMALWRWLHDPEMGFPQPMRLKQRRYWKLADLERWERSVAAEASPGRRSASDNRATA